MRWIATIGLLVACGCAEPRSGDAPGLDSGVAPCDTGIRQSWETFGQAFIVSRCQGCHASTAPNRYGAPVEVSFDDEAEVQIWAAQILIRAAGPEADMPPAGGISKEDQTRLKRWLRCDL